MSLKTFTKGENTQLNACVGKNGWPGTSYYANGFESAVHTICQDAISRGNDPDEIIYPIVFCARHRIELFLKIQIRSIERIKGNITVSDPKLMRTHDLGVLWKMYTTASSLCDPRYAEIIPLIEPTIREFSEIDPTGETFRYAYDNNNKKHLEASVSLINLEVFYSAFCGLSDGIKQAELLTDFLAHEYATGTYTKNASRAVIEDISRELPRQSDWANPLFGEIKNRISKKHAVSLRELSEIINIIKSHREFSFNIGEEIPIKDITTEKIISFLDLRIKATAEPSNINLRDSLLSNPGIDRELHLLLCKDYTIREMCALLALADVSRRLCYSEDYDGICDQYESGETDVVAFAIYLGGKSFIAPKIIDGLKCLRQTSTLQLISRSGINVGELPLR